MNSYKPIFLIVMLGGIVQDYLSTGCAWYRSSTEVNEAEIQKRTQPVDRHGAVFGRQQPCFPILDNPFNLGCALKKLLGAD